MKRYDDDDTVPAPWWARLVMVSVPFLIGVLVWVLIG